jgi:hypothetical protein
MCPVTSCDEALKALAYATHVIPERIRRHTSPSFGANVEAAYSATVT